MNKFDKYCLREISGLFYLMDISQLDLKSEEEFLDYCYKPPIQINYVGAKIVDLAKLGNSVEDIYKAISEEYDISYEEAKRDVDSFIEQIR